MVHPSAVRLIGLATITGTGVGLVAAVIVVARTFEGTILAPGSLT